jgi:hypothetical protein
MLAVDAVRIVWWVLYLVFGVPFCLFAAFRFYQYSDHPAIESRYPRITLIVLILYPVATISMALGRIVPTYPCFILVWQDYAIGCILILLYATRSFILYFKHEWVHERLKYFKREKERMAGREIQPMKMWFHNHRHWMDQNILLRKVTIVIIAFAIFPLYASIRMASVLRTMETNDICDENGWGLFVTSTQVVQIIFCALTSNVVRKTNDLYNVRNELKLTGISVFVVFIVYASAALSNQYGISPRFPISTFVAGIYCLCLSFIVGWLPVRSITRVETGLNLSLIRQLSSTEQISSREQEEEMKGVMNSMQFQNFQQFISDEVARAAFENFLLKAYAIENLCFYDSIVRYSQMVKELESGNSDEYNIRHKLLTEALQVYQQFMMDGAVLLVNISQQSKRSFEQSFTDVLSSGKPLSKNLSDWPEELQKLSVSELKALLEPQFGEILNLLVEDLLRKFKTTPEYQACSAGMRQNSRSKRPSTQTRVSVKVVAIPQ